MFKCSNVQMFKCSNVRMFKCSKVQMSNVKYPMSNVNKVKLLSECTSKVPPVISFQNQKFDPSVVIHFYQF